MYRQENEINGEDSSLLESDAAWVYQELPMSRRSLSCQFTRQSKKILLRNVL